MHNLSGRNFGLLTVIEKSAVRHSAHIVWLCSCSCGKSTMVSSDKLLRGNTKSCGCLKLAANRTHGGATAGQRDKEYDQWSSMKTRCQPNTRDRHRYFDRGIRVCDRWQSYANFLDDMGRCPPGMSLDRINNNRGYEPGNCRWATPKQQSQNREDNNRLTFNGQTLCLTEWARVLGYASPSHIRRRIEQGLTLAECLAPKRIHRRHNVTQLKDRAGY